MTFAVMATALTLTACSSDSDGDGDGNGDGLGGGRAVLVGDGHFKGFDLGFPGIELLDLVAGVVERIGPLPGGGIKGQLAVVRGERGIRAACGGVGTVGRAGAVGDDGIIEGGQVASALGVAAAPILVNGLAVDQALQSVLIVSAPVDTGGDQSGVGCH